MLKRHLIKQTKCVKLTQVTENATSQAHKLYFIDLFRDVAKIMFYIGRKKSPISIAFVRQ